MSRRPFAASLVLLLVLPAGATPTSASTRHLLCFDGDPPAPTRAATCEQMAAASQLRPAVRQQSGKAKAGAVEGAAKGALIGAGVGLGIGAIAALTFGDECEENFSSCTAMMLVGGPILGAGIGALTTVPGAGKGAVVGGGVGLAAGLIAGLVFGPGCEEGHAGCTAGVIVGGTATGALIGAIAGAVGGKD